MSAVLAHSERHSAIRRFESSHPSHTVRSLRYCFASCENRRRSRAFTRRSLLVRVEQHRFHVLRQDQGSDHSLFVCEPAASHEPFWHYLTVRGTTPLWQQLALPGGSLRLKAD